MWLASLTMAAVFGDPGSEIRADERVVLFPTSAHLDQRGENWICPVHGHVFEPEADSIKRTIALAALRRLLGLDSEQAESEIFRRRGRAFLVDNESGKRITVRMAGKTFTCEKSDSAGHFHGTFKLSLEVARARLAETGGDDGWLPLEAVTRDGDQRRFRGAVQLIAPGGLSVVSDIDDTIKISEVTDRKALLANTFLREFRAAPGMADLYGRFAAAGASFHYVTASPWQLYAPLEDFRRRQRFPAGTFHMKTFRLKDSVALTLFASPQKDKLAKIETLLARYPMRKFILVGDSGQQDPEVYGRVARGYPQRVAGIAIRDVTGQLHTSTRYMAAFQGIPQERWRLFKNPDEITGFADALIRAAE